MPRDRSGVQRVGIDPQGDPPAAARAAHVRRAGDRRRVDRRHGSAGTGGRPGRQPPVQPGDRRGDADRLPLRRPARVRHRRPSGRRRAASAFGSAAAGRAPGGRRRRPGRRFAVSGADALQAVLGAQVRQPGAAGDHPKAGRHGHHRLHQRVPRRQPAGDPCVRALVSRGLPRAGGDPAAPPGGVSDRRTGRPDAAPPHRPKQHRAARRALLRHEGDRLPVARPGPRPLAQRKGDVA